MKSAKPARQTRSPRGPFPHPFDVRTLDKEPRRVDLRATPEQCAAVAEAIGLPGIASLAASFHLHARAGKCIDVSGRVDATVTQTCVVTLEPFESVIRQEVDLEFAPETFDETLPEMRGRGGRMDLEIVVTPSVGGNDDQQDPPDLIRDDSIDLGAVAVEFMVLGLDPYPRKPGVHFDDMVVGEKDAPLPSPFAVLARLKDDS